MIGKLLNGFKVQSAYFCLCCQREESLRQPMKKMSKKYLELLRTESNRNRTMEDETRRRATRTMNEREWILRMEQKSDLLLFFYAPLCVSQVPPLCSLLLFTPGERLSKERKSKTSIFKP